MEKSIIIGAGRTTCDLIEYMKRLGYEFSDHFSLCLDNDSSLWGMELCGVKIDDVEKIGNASDTTIVISSIYERDILAQLKCLNVQGDIISHIDYRRKLMVDYQINQYHITHFDNLEKTGEGINELTVYTVIIGDYDCLHEVSDTDKHTKYICFTDDRSMCSDTWEIRYVDREFDNPIIESRKYKMLPHRFIDTEYSLYIDANIQFSKSPLEYMRQYFNRGNMLLIPHPERDCIYREAAYCILNDRDLPQRLIKQMHLYNKKDCPEHVGLFYGGMIGRCHFENEIVTFDEEWWEHFRKYSRRDQISLGYLLWKKASEVSLADINICNNDWFVVDSMHKKKQ
ncbi:MAG: DUF616 domain-containing protein [Lachnospiraceae bacterium]|nr:DUF616 domain-containing protein [Lachnospiraceae bacterium]